MLKNHGLAIRWFVKHHYFCYFCPQIQQTTLQERYNKQWQIRFVGIILTVLLCGCMHLMAQSADSTSLRPSFGIEYTGEVQTDFKRARMANLLQLSADVPLSRSLSFQLHSISTLATKQEPVAFALQGYSNIDSYNDIPFALSVAGLTWQLGERHSLFAGIRRTDEDYFCSDGLSLFTNSSCGIFPTITWNAYIGTFPDAAVGFHYAYDHKNLRLQASLYNGVGNHDFTGRYNVFRFCPNSDGLFALGQAEYRYRGSHYFLGGSTHINMDECSTAWAYAEQALSPKFTLLAAYSHTFGRYNICENFCGLGGKYSLKRADFGLFTDYTRVSDIDEWATELICSLRITDFLTVKPVFHFIVADHNTKCIGLLRVDVGI